MIRILLLAAFVVTPVAAQEAEPEAPPQRVRSVILYGDQTCPKAESPDEVVICADGGEPYRIPKALRKTEPGPGGTSWVRRAEVVDQANRVTLPGSCSPMGSFGQSGCTLQMLQQWRAERAAKKEADALIPGGGD